MKIFTITLHSSYNCGSTLQAFALQYFLIKEDYDVEIIDYHPSYISSEGRPFRNILRKIIFPKNYYSKWKIFKKFREQYLKVTPKRFKSLTQLEKNVPKGDVYIAGSDQIWNSFFNCGQDKAFYLSFVQGGLKFSYAASLGKDKVPDEEINWIKGNITDFDFISVRENSSKELLTKKDVRDVKFVCDPTLLIAPEVYHEMACQYDFGDYVAVYLVEKSDLLNETLLYFKEKFGYKIVGVGGYIPKYKCDIHIPEVGPCEFLGLIKNAKFVVATSFHATIFSLIFKKEFMIMPPIVNKLRVKEILNIVGLEYRFVKNKNEVINAINNIIDYEETDKKLQIFIKKSKNKLLKALQSTDAINNNVNQ